jgi:16S rRNA A1518/A1519 N6-dimethyltransferase RsmA/KsgA/DIM1 with predicted DNA glycosylase/AP lyase activity
MKCNEIIDIGSGDGRIPFCGSLLGLYSIGLELDSSLTQLQRQISESTKVPFEIINADGSDFDFSNQELSRPCFIISALPEMGEMFVENIIKRIKRKESNLL